MGSDLGKEIIRALGFPGLLSPSCIHHIEHSPFPTLGPCSAQSRPAWGAPGSPPQ